MEFMQLGESRRCPQCESRKVHRSRRHGLLERIASAVLISPYRCDNCDHRFFRFRAGHPTQARGRA